MPRPIEALVHTVALATNLARAREAAGGARVFAVVKADAYGHRITAAYEGLRSADGFALLDLAEAETVRTLGWRGPILLLEGAFHPRDLDACSRLNLWHVVHREQQIDWIAAHKTARPHRVFLKFNSGMNRLGLDASAWRAAWLRLDALPQVGEITAMTHFANADASSGDGVDANAGVNGGVNGAVRGAGSFEAAAAAFEAVSAEFAGERSIANSAAVLCRAPRVAGDGWVRPGIMLYGSSPDFPTHSIADWRLAPTMTLKSELIAVQRIDVGACVGYGSSYAAAAPMRIGVVACGYADGYPRLAPGGNDRGTPVLVDGVRTRTVGRVSMDMITVDLAPVPAAGIGSEVVLWGRSSAGEVLPIDDVAHAAGTVGYELMCARAPRVPVRVVP